MISNFKNITIYLVALRNSFSTSYEYFELDFIWTLKMSFKSFNSVTWFLTLQMDV